MIEKIKKHPELSKWVVDDCCENGICVTFSDDVELSTVVILKVDDFYNSLHIEKRPKSIDCLIVRKCKGIGFGLTLVELKDISSMGHYSVSDISAKFHTTLYDFIERRFKDQLLHDFKDIKLYFVSKIEVHKRDQGLKMETLINLRFNFQGRRLMIYPKMPSPAIKNCH